MKYLEDRHKAKEDQSSTPVLPRHQKGHHHCLSWHQDLTEFLVPSANQMPLTAMLEINSMLL